ncbi:MAG: alpha/beta hydrolase [Desulfobacteraceae bacterium]|nr:MAG: alpha/beta hydrolase [Desulfobacteraceae bacterium]
MFSLPAAASPTRNESVILLHGLARSDKSMAKLGRFLTEQGYMVININYPSRSKTIEELSATIIPHAIDACARNGAKKVHFVTHSMGGILTRYYLAHHQVANLGRVVMLSPPNQGSEVVDKLKGTPVFKWLNGPAGQQLGTRDGSLPAALGPVEYEVGIITGDRSINPILSLMIPGRDDGKVSVERAKLKGMKDFLIVHKSHPFIMQDPGVFSQVLAFLQTGGFNQ